MVEAMGDESVALGVEEVPFIDLRGAKPALQLLSDMKVFKPRLANSPCSDITVSERSVGVSRAQNDDGWLSGKKDGVDFAVCNYCGKNAATYRCSRCWVTRYCGKACRQEAWLTHKTECRRNMRPVEPTFDTKSTRSACARCLSFDRAKTPPELAARFVVVGSEILPDNYGASPEERGHYSVKERGVARTRWKCSCRGCHRVWWCVKSVDPDGVFESSLGWTDTIEGFKVDGQPHLIGPYSSNRCRVRNS